MNLLIFMLTRRGMTRPGCLSKPLIRSILHCVVIIVVVNSFATAAEIPIANVLRGEPVVFETEILPILQRSCLACHSAKEKQGDLVLETPEAMLKGGDSGPAVQPGKGAESLMLRLASHQMEPIMPPADNDVNATPLTSEELGLLRLWIDQGAKGNGGIAMLSPGKLLSVTPKFGPTLALSLTRDGQLLAASRGNQLDLYHTPSGRLITQLADPALADSATSRSAAHRDLIESVAFNAEGDLLASGSFREVKIWRRPRDVQRHKLAMAAPQTTVAASPDGQWIATAANNQIQLWNAVNGQAGATLTGHTDKISALRFSSDGKSLLSGSADATIRRWQLPEGTQAGIIDTPMPVLSLEIVDTQDPKTQPTQIPLVVVGSTDNLLRTFRWPESPQKLELAAPGDRRIQLSRDRKLAVVADSAGLIRILKSDDTQNWALVSEWKSDRTPVVAAEFASVQNNVDPPLVLVAAADGSLTLNQIGQATPLRRWRGKPSQLTTIAAAPDGRQFASGYESGNITLWRNQDPSSAALWAEPGRIEMTATQAHLARRALALGGMVNGSPVVLIHNLDNGQVTHTIRGHERPIRAIAFSADGTRLITGSDDQTVRVWDLNDPAAPEMKKFGPLAAAAVAVGVTTDLTQIISASADHKVQLWNFADGMLIKDMAGHTAHVMHVGLLAANQPFSISTDRTVRFWNPADGTQARAWEMPSVPTAIVVTPDLQRVFAAGDDKLLRCFQLSSGQVSQTFSGHTAAPHSIQLSADLKRVVTLANTASGADAYLWDAETTNMLEVCESTSVSSFALVEGQLHRALLVEATGRISTQPWYFWKFAEGNQQPITSLGYTQNSQQLLSTGKDGSLRGYQVENAQPTFNANHGAPINGMSVASNEQWMATAGENGSVRFWQLNGAGFGAQATNGLPPVRTVAILADNQRVVASTAGEKPTIHVIDPSTGSVLQKISVHAQPALQLLALNALGEILSSSADSVYRWDIAAMKQFPGHNGPIHALAAFPGAPMQVVTGSADTVVRSINLENGQVFSQFGHGGPVMGVAVRADGQRIASVSENHTLKLWNTNGQQLAELRGDIRRKTLVAQLTQQLTAADQRLNRAKQQVDVAEKDVPMKTDAAAKSAAALTAAMMDMQQKKTALTTANEQKLAAESASLMASTEARKMQMAKRAAEIAMKEAEAEQQVAQQRLAQRQAASDSAPNDAPLKQAAAEAQQVLTAAQARVLTQQQTVNTANQSATTSTTAANEAAQKVATTQKPYNDALAALKTAENAVRLTQQQDEIAKRELEQSTPQVPLVKELLAKAEQAIADNKTALETATKSLAESDQGIRHVVFSPNGRYLATAGEFSNAHVWDSETGMAIGAFSGHQGPLTGLAFVGDQQVVTSSSDQSAVVWELNPAWKLERTIGAIDKPDVISHRAMSVEFSADSARLLVAGGVPSRNGECHVFQVADGARILHLPQAHDDVIHAARFSPDGRRIATAGADKYVRTFDVASGQNLRRFEGHTNYVLDVAWKSDGQTLVSAGADNTVKVWDPDNADQRTTITNYTKHVTSVRFIGDTDNIVSSSGDKTIRMHTASNGGNFRNFTGPVTWTHCVDITPNLEYLAAGAADGSILIWNGNNGQLLHTIKR